MSAVRFTLRTGLGLLALTLALAGCASDDGAQAGAVSGAAQGAGYTAGDGSFTTWPAEQRPEAIDVSGTTFGGEDVALADARGDVVVLNFWYAGCPPCRAEAPTLNSLATKFAGDVQFVGVNVTDDSATAAGFERTYKSTYPSIVDQEGNASVQLAFASSKPPKAVPSTLVLDRKGRVTARIVGLANKSILDTLIQDAVDGNAA